MATITKAPKARTGRAQASTDAKVNLNFTIDCSKPVEDKVFNTSNFAEFLRSRIKIGGRTGKTG